MRRYGPPSKRVVLLTFGVGVILALLYLLADGSVPVRSG